MSSERKLDSKFRMTDFRVDIDARCIHRYYFSGYNLDIAGAAGELDVLQGIYSWGSLRARYTSVVIKDVIR